MHNDIQALQHDRLEAEKFIDKAAKLAKLKGNGIFKELFLKEYCETDVTRLVGLLANVEDEVKPKVVAELEAISRFKLHMQFIDQMGEAAQDRIAQIDEAILEIETEATEV